MVGSVWQRKVSTVPGFEGFSPTKYASCEAAIAAVWTVHPRATSRGVADEIRRMEWWFAVDNEIVAHAFPADGADYWLYLKPGAAR